MRCSVSMVLVSSAPTDCADPQLKLNSSTSRGRCARVRIRDGLNARRRCVRRWQRAKAYRRFRALPIPPLPHRRRCGQQLADLDFRPAIAKPEYQLEKGPLVRIDEGHHNFHTAEGRYKPFATFLRRDSFSVYWMNAPAASENPQFLLNVMHWLCAAI